MKYLQALSFPDLMKKMRILLDPQIFYKQPFGGISRYFTEIYRLFKDDARVKIDCPIYMSNNLHLIHYNLQPRGFVVLLRRVINKLLFWSSMLDKNKQYVKTRIRRNDIFIPTYYDPYFLSSIGQTPFVLTVFDMIHELFPQYFKNSPTIERKRLLMQKATRIIAISESTKLDIIRLYPHIPAEKINVVYLSHSVDPLGNLGDRSKYPADYILFVGRRGLYKNFTFLVKSVSQWLVKSQFSLCCLGGGGFNEEENKLIASLNLNQLVRQVDFQDQELAGYYRNALAFVFPSAYEGFGIPVLEAMACGCPVVLPFVGSFPEVAGKAGIYFELNDEASLLQRIQLLHQDVEFRQEKINLGFLQERKFSWERTKEECLKVYELALQ